MHLISEEFVWQKQCELLCEAERQRLVAKAGRASRGSASGVERSHRFRPANALRAVFGRG